MPSEETTLIWGRRPILDVVRHNAKKVRELYLKEGISSSFKKEIEDACRKDRVKIVTLPLQKFEKLFSSEVNHQGIAARIEAGTVSFSEWLSREPKTTGRAVLIFDHLEDVGNVGAIIRTALAAGVEAVLVPKDRQAPIDGTMYKASAGAVDRMTIVPIGNVSEALRKLKENDFWIMGLDMNADATIWEENFEGNVAFVIGSEGEGLHDLVRRECDTILTIPMEPGIESLNASVSAAILMYEWKRRAATRAQSRK